MSDGIKRLCRNYAMSMKWYMVEQDYEDEDWLREMVRSFIPIEALKNHYASGVIELDEFERLVGWKLGLEE